MSNKLLFKAIDSLLSEKGFKREGNYFRRQLGFVRQALFLQSSRHGDEYFLEMLITYSDLNPERNNTQRDAHLNARLSSYYNPVGDPKSQPEWTCKYQGLTENSALLVKQLPDALGVFLGWLDQYPSWSVAAEKMKQTAFATYVSRAALFEDIGVVVPLPQ